ncbi:hypothetical protein HYX18_01860 [Candidatus Woesearchaeota archaeon]|nr:hypothetical protein [Candidatus Woesearchaeota archaeon]
MKKAKWALALLIFGILFISACNNIEEKTICGDGICDKTESCACSDCENTEFCQVKNITKNCDDVNECTIDSFNPTTNTCVYETKANCCGNKKCELDEYACNLTTYETKCGRDCGLNCPPNLIIHKTKETKTNDLFSFTCSDTNCEQTSANQFRIKGASSVQTYITNVGERTSDTITSLFNCRIDTTKIAVTDNDNYLGTIFKDYFDEGLDKVDGINSRINPKNFVLYKFSVNITQPVSPKEIKCTITLTSSLYLQNLQELSITIY